MSEPAPDFLEALHRHAAPRPATPAFRLAGDKSDVVLDYEGMSERVACLGAGLANWGHASGSRIAICMENRPAWPVAYLATWYAGATVVPIDPALEPPAIQRILEHSEAVVVLTSRQQGPKVLSATADLANPPDVFDVDADAFHWDGEAPVDFETPDGPPCGSGWSAVALAATPEWAPTAETAEPGVIMYTSGTTGLPKGVMLRRSAIHSNVMDGLQRIDLRAGDHVLGVLPLFHALPVMTNFLAPMYIGAQVTFLTELNPERIIAAFPRFGITLFACVPLFFYRFHDRVMKKMSGLPPVRRKVAFGLLKLNAQLRRIGINLGPRLFAAAHEPFGPKLRTFLSGGAKFDARVIQDFIDLGFTMIQGYGLTEACAGLTAHPSDELRADTVGRALERVEVRIHKADKEGIGEVVARGPNLMSGYFKNDAATAEVVQDGWLHTGDLGRLLPNGHLQITGRAKDVIVLASGKNIYPEELEDYYSRSELIDEICILGIADPRRRGAERLHAIVVPDFDVARQRGQANVREEVTWEVEGLGLNLPGPQRLTSLEIRREPLPRTTTRKLKRFELKQAILERGNRAEAGDAVDAPTEVEDDGANDPPWAQRARRMLAEHAKVVAVARHQHLDIDLGLESLERVELHADLEDAFGLDIPQEAAGEVQTVGDLLDLLEKSGAGSDATTRTGGSPESWTRVLAETPPEVEPYLRDRLVGPAVLFGVARLAGLLQRVPGLRVAGVDRLPSDYPFMIAPNHLSYTDPFLLGICLPWRVFRRTFFVGYSAYFRGGIMGAIGRLLRTVPIDQNRSLEAAMQAAAAGLRREMVLGIFPEGARSADGSVKEFRRGTGILARELDVPVVPIGIWGTHQMWPREGSFRPHRAALVFGEPMRFGPEDADPAAFMKRVRDRVIKLADEAESLAAR
ncbi:MAG: AMP-binding protein [Acidobacteria bacterium]|nr:AMP-binding protein [Acidobacteriota bacterium]